MKPLYLLALGSVAFSNAYANSYEPAPVKLTDGFSMTPQLKTELYYNDNIYTNEFNPTSSAILVVTPSIKFGIDDGVNKLGGSYELVSGSYEVNSDDDYLDHKFGLFAHSELTDRHRIKLDLDYAHLHEDRGSGLNEDGSFNLAVPIIYDEFDSNLYYQHGASSALINVGAGAKYYFKEYKNYTEGANGTRFDNYDKATFFADADYQVGAVTYLTLDGSYADVAYEYLKSGEASKDNTDSNILLGLRWEGLGKTTGKAKLGYQYKTFEDDTREDFNGTTVDLGVVWEPINYSSFEWHLSRKAKDSDTVGDYILEASTSLSWDHDWAERFSSHLKLRYSNEDYVASSDDREDKTANASLSFAYIFTRWAKLNLGYQFTNKDSNSNNISYDQNAVNLGVSLSL